MLQQMSLIESVGNVLNNQAPSDDINGNIIGSLPSIQSWYSLLPGDADNKPENVHSDAISVLNQGLALAFPDPAQQQHQHGAHVIAYDGLQWSYDAQQQILLQQQHHDLVQQQLGLVSQAYRRAQYAASESLLFSTNPEDEPPSFVSIGSHPDIVDMLKQCMENETVGGKKPRKVVTTIGTQTAPQQIETRMAGLASSRSSCRFLYEFLEFLLSNPGYGSLIQWRNKEKRIFTLTDHHRVAELWGLHKRKKGMCYEKFSRALRFYYRKNILRKEPGRFTYRFINNTPSFASAGGFL